MDFYTSSRFKVEKERGLGSCDPISTFYTIDVCCFITYFDIRFWNQITWWNASGQLCSFTAQLIQFKVMRKRLITVNVHKECYFFVFLHRLISVMCLKCPPSAYVGVFSHECHWSMNASIAGCSMLCQKFFIHNWKEWVMQQARYCTSVMTSVSGRKVKKQIKTHETVPPNMKHIILANMNVKVYSWPCSNVSQGSEAKDLRGGTFNSVVLNKPFFKI